MDESGPFYWDNDNGTDIITDVLLRFWHCGDYIAPFEERFIKDYALSQMANLADYSEATRKIVMERMVARSVFRNFIDDTIQQGMIAVDQLRQITLEEKHNEQDNLGE